VATFGVKNKHQLPVSLMFQNEALFKRLSDPRACWAPAPHLQKVNLPLVREFAYEYAAVSPGNGSRDHMTCKKMNTDNMNRLLRQMSTKYCEE